MSFFGFDPTKPPAQTHNRRAPGFGPAPDPFAGLANRNADDEAEEALEFDDGDGLGDALEELGDDLNDTTFGEVNVGTDFNFSDQNSAGRERNPAQSGMAFQQQIYNVPSRPAQSGYEKYKRASEMTNLQPDASLWGLGPSANEQRQRQERQAPQQQQGLPSIEKATRSMMTLEEVEAMMRSQTQQPTPDPMVSSRSRMQDAGPGYDQSQRLQSMISPQPQQYQVEQRSGGYPPQHSMSRPQGFPSMEDGRQYSPANDLPQSAQQFNGGQQTQRPHAPHQRAPSGVSLTQLHHRGPSLNGQPVTRADQITQLSEEERAAFLRDEANRAKRNHKIHLLSKDNGIMTPYDKNFITRIQLQQLVTATGGADDDGPEATLAEDFYYQVFSQIYRARPDLPPDQFAQTYLNQLSWKGGSRRYPRGGETHMRRMEQQVQRAVEAAKARPKNKQLVVEGSLGKISFSNAKTPKPLLNIKRNDTPTAPAPRPRHEQSVAGRKAILRDVEKVYSSLMGIEDCERHQPQQPREESSGDEIQAYMDWRQRFTRLNQALWNDWKVLEPIDTNSATPHPFIAMLSHAKGKKLVPRVFRQIDDQQRLIVLTLIVVHLDQLDVIRDVQPYGQQEATPGVKNEVDLFAQAVEPSLFAYIGDAALSVVIGLVGLITERVNLQMVLQARVGVNLLTRLLSRAVLIVQSGHASAEDANQWNITKDALFDKVEPLLPLIFQSPIAASDDAYAWQFLAALGILANPDQQQQLVVGVKDRVMDTVNYAKSLPEDRGKADLDKVNLFMHAIGLDVDLLS